jgi:uncharacterized protein
MKRLTATICLTLAVLLGSVGVGWGADFQKGLTAYKRGDYATALRDLKALAEQGHASLQYKLGVIYRNGYGIVTQDHQEAVKWFRLAGKQGHAGAQYMLGIAYDHGFGVIKDAKKRVKWIRLSAEQGHAAAQLNLGEMYHAGYGIVPEDHSKAAMWNRRSAEQGNAIAQTIIAGYYFLGRGVPKDLVRAYKWARVSVSNGRKSANKLIHIITKVMTQSEFERGEELARNFLPKKTSKNSTARKSTGDTDRFGSGFVVSSTGHIITNYHVVKGCRKVKIHHQGMSVVAKVVAFDTVNDLALLKGKLSPSTVLSLSTETPERLQDVYVAGYPFGREISTSVKITKGIISDIYGIRNNASQIQIDAALQPGNSGGPIVDHKGNVIGVAVGKLNSKIALKRYGALPENTNFGIKSSVVRSFLEGKKITLSRPNSSSISKSNLGKIIADGTYALSCWIATRVNALEGFLAHKKGDYITALRHIEPLANQGNANAQTNLGSMYAEGKGVPQDYKTAVKWWTLAAEQGFAAAQSNLGLMYQKGDGVPQDFKTAVKLYRLAAEQGFALAQYNLGVSYEHGEGVPKDFKTAAKLYRLAAEQGNEPARHNLGLMYAEGKGVPQDYKTAVKLYRLAAVQGFAAAQFNLGFMYYKGHGVPQDYKTAVKWFKRSAKQGNAPAQRNLGLMYAEGKGVPQDYKTAVKWYILSAEQGFAAAQTSLGLMYDNGQGVQQDYKTAVKWWTLAAEQGFANAQFNLGLMYAKGERVKRNYARTHMWWSIAASSGYKRAVKYRDKVAGMMTPAQIADAQKLIRECVRKKYKGC